MNKLLVLKTISDFKKYRSTLTGSVGFVPTMGALHAGHASLMQQSRTENAHTILSLFVNPTQFNDAKDLEKYPRTFEADLEIATENGVSAILCPDFNEMYPDEYTYSVMEKSFSKKLCGASRPGHFDGVLTVVMKLFNIVEPHKAYFGEKDYQQLQLIKNMVSAFFMPIEICAVKTLRENSGLALSSRNIRLSGEGKQKAALIYKAITDSKTTEQAKTFLADHGFQVDYLEDIENRRFVAAFLEGIRLIDNVAK